jgi:hypothetical protein
MFEGDGRRLCATNLTPNETLYHTDFKFLIGRAISVSLAEDGRSCHFLDAVSQISLTWFLTFHMAEYRPSSSQSSRGRYIRFWREVMFEIARHSLVASNAQILYSYQRLSEMKPARLNILLNNKELYLES